MQIITVPSYQAKALGVHLDMEMNTIHVFTPQVDVISTDTKRQVTSTIARIFNLMGRHDPAMIQAKIILQQLWKLQLNWDEKPPDDLRFLEIHATHVKEKLIAQFPDLEAHKSG